jgi:hypothetical protein
MTITATRFATQREDPCSALISAARSLAKDTSGRTRARLAVDRLGCSNALPAASGRNNQRSTTIRPALATPTNAHQRRISAHLAGASRGAHLAAVAELIRSKYQGGAGAPRAGASGRPLPRGPGLPRAGPPPSRADQTSFRHRSGCNRGHLPRAAIIQLAHRVGHSLQSRSTRPATPTLDGGTHSHGFGTYEEHGPD